jgi:galactitol PTS system EIIC component
LKSGLFVGVGFVGLGVVTALLTTNFNDPLKAISDIYHLHRLWRSGSPYYNRCSG